MDPVDLIITSLRLSATQVQRFSSDHQNSSSLVIGQTHGYDCPLVWLHDITPSSSGTQELIYALFILAYKNILYLSCVTRVVIGW
ncbi:hypothetical protein GDO81_019700 [Engystomops pustulosus]|uniref:Uncharacterized protein n=1 Tax=Engystomops pustulosus TaxID=76066 RepID=A0AAV6YTI1_ENGPU|nr:hypothetical protein GDO81_019700 [Engystomops pustulosus]